MRVYLIMWETCSGENGYFLPSGDAVHAIDGRYARLDHLLWVNTTLGVYRLTCDMEIVIRQPIMCSSLKRRRCCFVTVCIHPCAAAAAPLPSSQLLAGSCDAFKSWRCEGSLYMTCTSMGIYSICSYFYILFIYLFVFSYCYFALTKIFFYDQEQKRTHDIQEVLRQDRWSSIDRFARSIKDTACKHTHIQSYRAEATSVWTRWKGRNGSYPTCPRTPESVGCLL